MGRPARIRTRKPPSRLFLAAGLSILLVALDIRIVTLLLRWQPLGLDWSPLWAATRMAATDVAGIYDFARITRAQAPLIGIASDLRPFAYPPSAIAVFAPFAFLPVLLSYAVWTAVTGAFFLLQSSKLTQRWWILPAASPFVLATVAGQTTFMIGGLMILGLRLLEQKPVCGGLLLGMATAIKPQILVLVPLALVVAGNWRSLGSWAVAVAGMLVLSLALFGPEVWRDWLPALPRFQSMIAHSDALTYNAITPYALAQRSGYAGWWVLALALPAALAAIWATFRTSHCVADRLIALAGGAMLLSPYAMNYELTLIAPAMLAGRRSAFGAVAVIFATSLSLLFGLGLWAIIFAMAPRALRSARFCRHRRTAPDGLEHPSQWQPRRGGRQPSELRARTPRSSFV